MEVSAARLHLPGLGHAGMDTAPAAGLSQFIPALRHGEILQAPIVLGNGISIANMIKTKQLKLLNYEKLGDDIRMIYGKNLSD